MARGGALGFWWSTVESKGLEPSSQKVRRSPCHPGKSQAMRQFIDHFNPTSRNKYWKTSQRKPTLNRNSQKILNSSMLLPFLDPKKTSKTHPSPHPKKKTTTVYSHRTRIPQFLGHVLQQSWGHNETLQRLTQGGNDDTCVGRIWTPDRKDSPQRRRPF